MALFLWRDRESVWEGVVVYVSKGTHATLQSSGSKVLEPSMTSGSGFVRAVWARSDLNCAALAPRSSFALHGGVFLSCLQYLSDG